MQSKSLKRIQNKNMVLDLIRKHRSIYRAELARITGLSMPTIMSITDELVESGLVRDAGKGISSGGKPPMLMEIIPDSHLFLGVDISGAMYKGTILNLQGDVVYSKSLEKEDRPEGEIVDCIRQFVDTLLEESKIDITKLSGMGLGIPGLVDTEKGTVINSIDYDLKNEDLRTPLRQIYNLPVFIENSSKVMAIGEKWFGAGADCDDFALVTVGRGIGAALFINGEIYQGHNSMSGELGHMVINPNGPICKCGRRGCLEAMASGKAIANQARNIVSMGSNSIMLDLAGREPKKIRAETVFRAAAMGDVLAEKIADEAVINLCIGLTNLVFLFDCQRIVLTGYVVKDNSYLLEKISQRVNSTRSLYFGDVPVEVCLSELGEEAAVIGAATLPLQNFVINSK